MLTERYAASPNRINFLSTFRSLPNSPLLKSDILACNHILSEGFSPPLLPPNEVATPVSSRAYALAAQLFPEEVLQIPFDGMGKVDDSMQFNPELEYEQTLTLVPLETCGNNMCVRGSSVLTCLGWSNVFVYSVFSLPPPFFFIA